MEKLKTIIPWELKNLIQESTPDDLPSTCSSLHDFFSQSLLFHSMIQDLTNTQLGFFAKNKQTALEMKFQGNACFSSHDYSQALHFYSQALRVAPVDATDKDNNLVATLFVNRASALYKLTLLEESLRDCNRALSVSPRYAKAWFRRGKVKTSLLNYEDAVCDLKVALSMEGTCSGKRQIETDIKSILNQNTTGRSSAKSNGIPSLLSEDDIPQEKVQCLMTKYKGRGMASLSNIPPACLIHREEPFAAIILKSFRESHCHFCLNELPVDTVPCPSCSMPLYCSEDCQLQAGGQVSGKCVTNNEGLSGELEGCLSKVTLGHSEAKSETFTEHGHECHGMNWPAVLPSEVVLAGRILIKLLESDEQSFSTKKLDLSHNYVEFLPEIKLELHVHSIVLLHCLYHSYGPKVVLNGECAAKIVILISQVKVNSMAIVRMKSPDQHTIGQPESSTFTGDSGTSSLEQVRVGQAIYLNGSLFNHSCMPNINAYFISRTLLIRATEYVLPGCPLELSYGPEVGKLGYRERQQFLQDNYSFKCECDSCSRINFPDLVLNAFHCATRDCSGVVLDDYTVEYVRDKTRQLQAAPEAHNLKQKNQVNTNDDGTRDVASLVFERSNHSLEIHQGCCLNCGSSTDMKSLRALVHEADVCIQSLQEAVTSDGVNPSSLSNVLSHLEVLKSTLHPYNKKLAEAHDILAEALCSVGETRRAMDHCIASIEILKELYHPGHITLGNELVKLSSLQLALADAGITTTVNQIDAIFSNYYGRHAEQMFPYLQHLKWEVRKLTMKDCRNAPTPS